MLVFGNEIPLPIHSLFEQLGKLECMNYSRYHGCRIGTPNPLGDSQPEFSDAVNEVERVLQDAVGASPALPDNA